MSGNRNSGRRPKPTAALKLTGHFRRDRHDGRAVETSATGRPTCPRWLSGEARRLWLRVVPQLVAMGVAKSIDQSELAGLCRWWSIWRERDTQANGGDADAINLARTAWQQFSQVASRFGLSPADRIRLTVPAKQHEKHDPAARYFA